MPLWYLESSAVLPDRTLSSQVSYLLSFHRCSRALVGPHQLRPMDTSPINLLDDALKTAHTFTSVALAVVNILGY